MVTVAIIPARGGSKGVPRKNIRPLAGKPLIAHSILDAQEAQWVDQVYVSTDNEEIAEISATYGAQIIPRPPELANDTASSESALIHSLQYLETQGILPELMVFLQCTSPIRTGLEIDGAIAKLKQEQADSLLSVSPSHRFLWQEVDGVVQSINYDYRYRPRRQDMNPQYVENGSIYVFKPWILKETGNRLGGKISLFVMSEMAALEIDSLEDFEMIDFLMNRSQ
ncbi:acylneuraminate cytidylyltransferase family protein [Crocosphaera sp. UHCC 0190]|uniref:acylneuraminate cytidylyltransferase family protein n=1 Tax=Crocosphaera sp. UHCC 0190 TaxID=3110246 RepID=UPI002B2212BA|nr:acylneuraminate cytidylyltransferase family protein [Crocosphaera sp. UHCC 0190]MEA5509375.1 acylneuraminate cytidylyltransferase family protein [Crocosphaera sp. UHCC 0190]